MIRQLAVLAVAAICLTGSTTARTIDTEPTREFLEFQDFSNLVMTFHPYAPVHETIKINAEKWSWEDEYADKWLDKEAFIKLRTMYRRGMLPQNYIFSLFDSSHREQAITLFRVFYTAPTFEMLIQITSYAHMHMNQEMFIYSYSVAILHKRETQGILLLPPQMVLTNKFFNTDFMKSYADLRTAIYRERENVTYGGAIDAYYTHSYVAGTRDPERKLTYFLEDIGINICYYYMHLMTPRWMSSKDYPISTYRGLLWFFSIKWLVNRYELERDSHGMKQMEILNWNKKIHTGYLPMMMHYNGLLFPQRPEWFDAPFVRNSEIEELINYEDRVKVGMDLANFMADNGTHVPLADDLRSVNIVANIAEGNADSIGLNFYGSIDKLARIILANSPRRRNEDFVMHGALEDFATTLRDPAFYRMSSRIVDYFKKLLKHVEPRKKQDLEETGLTLDSFKVDPIITYFEPYDTIVSNETVSNDKHVEIKARQMRLNHRRFDYHIDVTSDKIAKVVVRIFMGPTPKKSNYLTPEDYSKFLLIDYSQKQLVVGENKFTRSSTDSPLGIPDFDPWMESEKRNSKLGFGWPQRMLFPKGTCSGYNVTFFAIVTKFEPYDADTSSSVNFPWPELDLDNKPWDYPLDRPMETDILTNAKFNFTLIFHKKESDINRTI